MQMTSEQQAATENMGNAVDTVIRSGQLSKDLCAMLRRERVAHLEAFGNVYATQTKMEK